MSIMGKLGSMALPAGFAYMDYSYARKEGRSKTSSLVSAAGEFAMGEMLGMAYPALILAKETPGLISGAVSSMAQQQRMMSHRGINTPFNSSTFIDTRGSATMRQHAMSAISRDKAQRQVLTLGQEAKYIGR